MTQTNKLGYLNGNGRKCQSPAKNSQMSGSKQALEVGIVDVEKATKVISGRRRLFSATRLTDARKPAQSLQPLRAIPGGLMVAMSVYLIFDFVVILLLFAMSFKFLRDAKIQRRDVWIGAVMTAILFGIDIPAILDGEKINRGRSRNIFYIIGVIVVIVIVLKLLGLF
jgi:hypothetical protein